MGNIRARPSCPVRERRGNVPVDRISSTKTAKASQMGALVKACVGGWGVWADELRRGSYSKGGGDTSRAIAREANKDSVRSSSVNTQQTAHLLVGLHVGQQLDLCGGLDLVRRPHGEHGHELEHREEQLVILPFLRNGRVRQTLVLLHLIPNAECGARRRCTGWGTTDQAREYPYEAKQRCYRNRSPYCGARAGIGRSEAPLTRQGSIHARTSHDRSTGIRSFSMTFHLPSMSCTGHVSGSSWRISRSRSCTHSAESMCGHVSARDGSLPGAFAYARSLMKLIMR